MIVLINKNNSQVCKKLPINNIDLFDDALYRVYMFGHTFLIPKDYKLVNAAELPVKTDVEKIGIKQTIQMYSQFTKHLTITREKQR